ncbi:MAG TPA: two-component regulator propeller domain-containing protein [Blastocatellia bacterium]|nr:two-component regulator propeller domain-containing protein [Blastocatellia bacterium]
MFATHWKRVVLGVLSQRVGIAWLLLALIGISGKTAAERLPIKTYTTADGLVRDHINRIVQDSKGFLWFSTPEGLSRFDGYKFTNYGTDEGLADRNVNDFLETRSGGYWAATNKGLCRLIEDPLPNAGAARPSGRKFEIYFPREDPKARFINVILEDHAGTVWCGTAAGLFRLDLGSGKPVFSFVDIIQPAAGDDKLEVEGVIEDRHGSLWIAAPSGLDRLRPDGVVERYGAEDGLPLDFSGALLEDRDGRIWAGTRLGLYQLVAEPKPHHRVVDRVYTSREGLPSNNVRSLSQSADGTLWVGTDLGLSALPPSPHKEHARFRTYTQPDGLLAAEITTLSEDRDRNLWIGTASSGAMRLAANGFATYKETDGLSRTRVASILEDRAGELCVIATNGVASRLDHGRFLAVQLPLPKGIDDWGWGWYQIMFQDSRGEWWMSTAGGLVRYPKVGSFGQIAHTRPRAVYTTRDGLPQNTIFRIFEDSRGDVWISTLGNPKAVLTRWERASGTLHPYALPGGILDSAPTAFCEDGSGNLWIGLYNGGLLRYHAGSFTAFTTADGVPPGFIRALYLDHNRRLWIASGEGGLGRVDRPEVEHPRFVTYSIAQGLSSNQATCVTEDQWGMIYVGTGRGVDKLDPTSGHIRHYTTADGLATSFVNVSLRDQEGSLWFGTLQGLSKLVPQVEQPASPPPIRITSLEVAGIPYPLPELGVANMTGPELDASQNHIQIDFSGLSIASADSPRYEYKLEGAVSEWSAPTDVRVVSYPNLAPGSYRFLVRAVSADGVLSESPAAVSFSILPPIWQRWWFRLLGLILVAAPMVTVARYRYQKMKAMDAAEEAVRRSREERLAELERVRTRIATDLHDDIGSTLSQIYLLSEVVRQRVGSDDSAVMGPLALISNASHDVVNSMSDIVWAINPQKDHVSDLVQRMRRFASDTFAAADITFRFTTPDVDTDVRLGADIRREVFLIFKESVNNLVKHSGCTEADIEFQIANHSLSLKVTDNGIGFDQGLESTGHGLASLRERARGLGGKLKVVSTRGQGTTVSLSALLA